MIIRVIYLYKCPNVKLELIIDNHVLCPFGQFQCNLFIQFIYLKCKNILS